MRLSHNLFSLTAVQCQSPTVITLPEALVTSSGNVVEGSVIQVYCTVENNNDISFTWTLNGTALLNDPLHIRIRSNVDGSDTTSVLIVDNFRDTDNGDYQCTATDTRSMDASNGTAVSLTGRYALCVLLHALDNTQPICVKLCQQSH